MRKSLIPVVFAAALGTAGAALAHQSAGLIKAIDTTTGKVTLADGHVYGFGTSKDAENMLKNFRIGDNVVVSWHEEGKAYVGETIKGANS